MGLAHERFLLKKLCEYWRLDYDEVTPIETQQMLFIYNRLNDGREMRDILYETSILRANIRGRSKRRKLGIIYWRLKERAMSDSGRYDYSTMKAPTTPFKQNYY